MEHLAILLVSDGSLCVILLMGVRTLTDTVLLVSDGTLSDAVCVGSLCDTVGECWNT